MNFARFLLFPALAALAASCVPNGSETKADLVGATIDSSTTTPTNTYSISVTDTEPISPRKVMTGTIDSTLITVDYGSPSVRNRVIWGGLEPFGEVWRSGANEATTVQFSTDVFIEGKPLPRGRFGFFTIPGKEKWTVIINSVADQWGDFDYDATKDLLRVDVTPQNKSENAEQLDYLIEGSNLVLRWEKIAVPIKIQTIRE